jgi:separase
MVLLTAENFGVKDATLNELAKPTTSLSGRIKFMTLLSNAAYVHSLFAMQTGHPKEALKHAKHCVTLNRRMWASMENRNSPQPTSKSDIGDAEMDQIAADVEGVSISAQAAPASMSITHASLTGSGFWPIVPSLYRGLTQLATVLAHQGDFQQSVYYLEQAYRIADSVKAANLIVWNLSARADTWMKGGKLDKAFGLLEQADPLVEQIGQHKSLMLYHGCSALVKRSKGEWDEEMRTYGVAESMLEQLSSANFIQQLEKADCGYDSLVNKVEQLSLEAPAKKSRAATGKSTKAVRAAKTAPTRKPATKSAAKAPRKTAISKQQPAEILSSEECQPLSSLRGDLLRRRAIASLLQSKVIEAGELLAQAEKHYRGQEGFIAQNAVHFRRLMSLYTKAIASDFTYSVLPESTISFPAVASQKSSDSLGSRHSLASPQKASLALSSRKSDVKEDFVSILRQAKESLSEVQSIALQIGSISTVNQICTFTSQISILLSATNLGQSRSTLHPLQTAYLFGRIVLARIQNYT